MCDRLEITKAIERAVSSADGEQDLCRLALRASKAVKNSQNDASIAFDWAENRELDDPSRIKDAISKIKALGEIEFYKAAVLLLWIEAHRGENTRETEHCKKNIELIISEMDRKVPVDSRMVNWVDFFHPEFVKCWSREVSKILTIQMSVDVLCRGEGPQVVSLLLCLLDSKNNPSESEVELVFRRAVAIALRIERESEKTQSLSVLIQKLMKRRRFYQAEQMARRIGEDQSREKILYAIAEGMAQAGDFQRAVAIVNNARVDNNKTAVLFSIMGLAFASLTIRESTEIAYRIVAGRNRDTALIVVAKGLAGSGGIRESLKIADDIEDKERKSDLLLYVVQRALDRNASWQDAEKIAESVPLAYCKAEALTLITEFMVRAGQGTQAMEIARRIDDLRYRDSALAKIVHYYLSIEMFEQALQVIDGIESDGAKHKAISQTVEALAEKQTDRQNPVLFRQIVEIAGHIRNRRLKSRSLSVILEKFPRAGVYSGATRRIEETGEKIRLLLLMAQASIKEEEFARADIKFEKAISAVKPDQSDALQDLAEIGRVLALAERQAGRTLFAKAKLELRSAFEKKTTQACHLENKRQARSLVEIARALLKAELKDVAQSVLEKAVESAHRIEGERDRWKSLRMIIGELIASGQDEWARKEVDRALESFRQIPAPDRYAILLQVSQALAFWRKRQHAWQVLKESIDAALKIEKVEYRLVEAHTCTYYEPVNVRLQALSEIIWNIGRLGMFGLAIESVDYIADNTEEYWDRSKAMSDIASMMVEANEFSKATALAHKNKSSLSGKNIIGRLLDGLIDTNRFQDALDLANSHIKKPEMKYKALLDIGRAVEQSGENRSDWIFEQAIATARRMDNRIQGGEEKAQALLCIVRESANTKRRNDIFVQAIDATHSISNPKVKYQVLANIAEVMERMGNEKMATLAWQKAAVPAPEIENVGARYSAIVTVLQALPKNEIRTGYPLLKHALKAACCLKNTKNRNLSLSMVAALTSEYRDFSAAWAILKKNIFPAHSAESDWHHYMALLEIAGLLAESGEVSQTQALISNVPVGPYADQILTSMAHGFLRAGLFELALETLRRMNIWSLVRTLPSIAEMLVTKGRKGAEALQQIIDYVDRQDRLYVWGDEFWPGLARIQLAGGLFEAAIDSAMRIGKVQVKYDILLLIIQASAKKKETDALLPKLMNIATDIGMPGWHENDLYYKTRILVAVANTHASSGNIEGALEILERALKIAGSISEESVKYVGARSEKSLAMLEVARAFVKSGRPRQALKIVCKIKDDELRGTYEHCEALTTISEDLVREKEFDCALEAAGKLSREWERKKIYLQITEGLVGEKKFEKALEIASMMRESPYGCIVLSVIARDLRRQDSERADMLFTQAIEMAFQIQDRDIQACSVYEITQSMANSGSLDWAAEVANDIDSANYRSKALLKLALFAMHKRDERKTAALFTQTIESTCSLVGSDREKFLSRLVQALLKAKDFDQALTTAKKIENVYQRSELLSATACDYLKNGDWQNALDTASFIENDFDCYRTMEMIVDHLSELNNDQRTKLLDKSLKIARNMGKYRGQLLLAVTRALLTAGERGQAVVVLQMRALSEYPICDTFSPTVTNGDSLELLKNALATMALSSLDAEKIVKVFQQDVVKNFPAPFSLLKQTFGLLPFSPSLACYSVRMLQLARLKAGDRKLYRQLVEIFPLAFLIEQ